VLLDRFIIPTSLTKSKFIPRSFSEVVFTSVSSSKIFTPRFGQKETPLSGGFLLEELAVVLN
jgi:hypothetical protein